MFTPDTDAEVLIISLKVIVDLLTIYGLALVEKNEDEEEEASDSRREEEKKIFLGGTSLTDLIQALADHLEHEVCFICTFFGKKCWWKSRFFEKLKNFCDFCSL